MQRNQNPIVRPKNAGLRTVLLPQTTTFLFVKKSEDSSNDHKVKI